MLIELGKPRQEQSGFLAKDTQQVAGGVGTADMDTGEAVLYEEKIQIAGTK